MVYTIAFEIELESEDMNIQFPKKIERVDYKKILKSKLPIEINGEFANKVINRIDFSDEEKNDKLLNWEKYKSKKEKIIIYELFNLYQDILNLIEKDIDKIGNGKSECDETLSYLKNKIQEYLPNFFIKYNNELEYVIETSLLRGVEIKQKTYIKGIDKSLLFLNDFFEDFNNQDYWKFTHRTSLHINIGIDKKVKWDIVKGVLMINDYDKTKKPYVFDNMECRVDNRFNNSIRPLLKTDKDIKKQISKLFHNFGQKYFGFNIDKIKTDNYVEFRYIGGVVSKELVVDKLYYFCDIIKKMIK